MTKLTKSLQCLKFSPKKLHHIRKWSCKAWDYETITPKEKIRVVQHNTIAQFDHKEILLCMVQSQRTFIRGYALPSEYAIEGKPLSSSDLCVDLFKYYQIGFPYSDIKKGRAKFYRLVERWLTDFYKVVERDATDTTTKHNV